MKKIAMFMLALCLMLTFSSCIEEPEQSSAGYVATTKCLFSTDNGQTYGENTRVFNVGSKVLMAVRVNVKSESTSENVGLTVQIPNSEAVECVYMDGPISTTTHNPVGNITEYNFSIPSSPDSEDSMLVFSLVANSETSLSIKLEFDENIDASYDKVETIEFISRQQ